MQLRKPLLNIVELYIAPPIIQRSSNIRCFFYEQKWEESDISGKPSPVAHPPRQSQLSLSHIPWFYLVSFIDKLLFIDCLFSVFLLSFFFCKVCSKKMTWDPRIFLVVCCLCYDVYILPLLRSRIDFMLNQSNTSHTLSCYRSPCFYNAMKTI